MIQSKIGLPLFALFLSRLETKGCPNADRVPQTMVALCRIPRFICSSSARERVISWKMYNIIIIIKETNLNTLYSMYSSCQHFTPPPPHTKKYDVPLTLICIKWFFSMSVTLFSNFSRSAFILITCNEEQQSDTSHLNFFYSIQNRSSHMDVLGHHKNCQINKNLNFF